MVYSTFQLDPLDVVRFTKSTLQRIPTVYAELGALTRGNRSLVNGIVAPAGIMLRARVQSRPNRSPVSVQENFGTKSTTTTNDP